MAQASDAQLDLFFSYAWGEAKVNQKRVEYLKKYLEKEYHYKIWMDIDVVAVGQQLFSEIEKGMRNSACVVVILTKEYPLSVNCQKEISLADALGKPLIPLMFESVEWPPVGLGMYLSGSVYLKFKEATATDRQGVIRENFWDEKIMEQLRGQIREYVKDPELQEADAKNASHAQKPAFEISGNEDSKVGKITSATWEYTGDVVKNMPHGRGTKKWKSGVIHYGEWKQGQAQGAGIRIWNDGGGQFSGDWNAGQWIYGTYSWPDGGRYVGEFHNFKRHGDGIFKYSNGDRYVGGWKADIKDGWGIYTYKNSTQYSGDYKENRKEGVGKMKYENGDVYEGRWNNNKKHGKGFYAYATGNSYDGDWDCDIKHGFGVFVYHHGDRYEGTWDKSKRNGKGIYHFANGDIYDGNWVLDIKAGYGHYTYGGTRKGDDYKGNWKDGKKHGHGRYVFADGRFYDGDWEMNTRVGEILPASENPEFQANGGLKRENTMSAGGNSIKPISSISTVENVRADRMLQNSQNYQGPPPAYSSNDEHNRGTADEVLEGPAGIRKLSTIAEPKNVETHQEPVQLKKANPRKPPPRFDDAPKKKDDAMANVVAQKKAEERLKTMKQSSQSTKPMFLDDPHMSRKMPDVAPTKSKAGCVVM